MELLDEFGRNILKNLTRVFSAVLGLLCFYGCAFLIFEIKENFEKLAEIEEPLHMHMGVVFAFVLGVSTLVLLIMVLIRMIWIYWSFAFISTEKKISEAERISFDTELSRGVRENLSKRWAYLSKDDRKNNIDQQVFFELERWISCLNLMVLRFNPEVSDLERGFVDELKKEIQKWKDCLAARKKEIDDEFKRIREESS